MKAKFKKLKQAFSSPPVRAYPSYEDCKKGNKFIITTDYSATAISAILSQVQDGRERLIAAQGRKCNGAESWYDSMKGEMLALVFALKKFEHILLYDKFVWKTDSKDCLYWQTAKRESPIFSRWYEYLSRFNFEAQHVPGASNTLADAISRSSHLPEPTLEDADECFECEDKDYTYPGLNVITRRQQKEQDQKLIREEQVEQKEQDQKLIREEQVEQKEQDQKLIRRVQICCLNRS